ncbi:ectonucleotide pyrophosphatase/phosphodiesterase [Mucilaginibacter sp. UR6-11]|uniref:alkaline phosphatase family protein n=1 Tax=Mucilaginibacter sp. UR6-11 TaxID=1435644 RepID=UPI001E5927A4|nr:ectonucleotide pyrophosphatase/phosphodiesterase [Mucilaginibacter sp. UR6-11]MCC8423692.1 ectonucleotide pyrophosphatase/phosphodiesterase [Mucilaginibacter sp. UR6-11]
MKKINLLLLFLFCCNAVFAQNDSLQNIVEGRVNSAEQMRKPYVVLICSDAFRWDYAQKYQAKNLLKFSAEGVRAASMMPSFPASTHANHFALVSGLYPSHSGIVGNEFYDPARNEMFKPRDASWFGEEPIWVTAEKQKMLTASFLYIDTDPAIKGVHITYLYKHLKNHVYTAEERGRALKDWLSLPEEKRPHFIACYIPDADHAGHTYGPNSAEVKNAVAFVDDVVGKMVEAAKSTGMPVNFIFVSDHGMFNFDREHRLQIPSTIDKDKFITVSQGNYVSLYAKNPADIMPMYEKLKAEHADGYDVVLKKDLPPILHFGTGDDRYNRIGDIMLMAQHPKIFTNSTGYGAHGFDGHEVKDNQATFFAWGPAFKPHLEIPTFDNIEVYDVMTKILAIKGLPNDGTGTIAKEILK